LEKQITLAQNLDTASETAKNAMYHVMPGCVTSYDAANQVADIQPMVNDVRTDPDTQARVSEPFLVIPSVPIIWPRFGKFVIAGRLNKNDPVLLIAFDLDPTAWRQTSGGTPSDPPDVSRHAGKYWAAFPCDLRVNPIKGAGVAQFALYVGLDGGDPVIVINDSTIQLGSSSADAAALASKVDAGFSDLAEALNGHVHVVASFGPSSPAGTAGSSGVAPPVTGATPATTPVGPITTTASTLVKIQK
jgi:hypothetical protein